MGGFADVLGHVATGFEGARQKDVQRNFEDEQARRNAMGGFLQQIALDENTPADVRNAAFQAHVQLGQTPWNKKTDVKAFFDPILQAHVASARGGAGNPVDTQAGSGAPQVGTPPAPSSILGSPEQTTANMAARTGAVTGAKETAEIGARQHALAGMGLPPQQSAMLALGVPGTTLTRTIGSGGGLAGQLRAQGRPVPPEIPDNQWVNERELAGGMSTYVAGPPPAAYGIDSTTGGAVPKQQLDMAKEQRELALWQKKNAVQFHQRIALQQNALNNALTKGDYTSAKKIINTDQSNLQDATDRARTMDENIVRAKAGDQQAMLSLVANHIGMTLGAQKGARITQSTWNEAVQSAPWLQRAGAHFDDRGLLTGVTLSPQQMDQMVSLAHEKTGVLKDHVANAQETYQKDLSARPPGKASLTEPPAPGGAGASSGYIFARDPQGKLHRAPAGTALPSGWKVEASK